MRFLQQLRFGLRVFFRHLTPQQYLRIFAFMFKRYILRRPLPFSVVFAITYKCQCGCIHCSVNDYGRCGQDLSADEVKAVIDFIADWGPVKITFFGGEPLLRPEIPEFVAYASAKGIRASIDTNGLNLTEEMAIKLKKAGVSNINVSVDSAEPRIHDALRGHEGCFAAAEKALELCAREKIPCLVSTYASKRALESKDLEHIISLARRKGIDGVKVLFPILSGKWRQEEKERLSPEEEKYLLSLTDPSFVYIEDALEMLKKKGKGCSALEKNLIYISPYGDVQPCPAIPISFGNIRKKKIGEIIPAMFSHPLYGKQFACQMCLMNEPGFRKLYFESKGSSALPLAVEDFKF